MKVLIPITILKAGGVVTPVSLGLLEIFPGYDPALVVNYSDGTQKVVLTDSENRKYKTASGTATGFDVSDGCESITPYTGDLQASFEGETIEASFSWDRCQMNGDYPQGMVIMDFGDYVAEYDATSSEEDTFLPAVLADWVIHEK